MGEGRSQTEGESKQTTSILHIQQAAIFLLKGITENRTVVINVSYCFIVGSSPLQQAGMMIRHIGIVINSVS